MLVLTELPQFLYQEPPGAQQLTRPVFSNVPHLGQIVLDEVSGVVVVNVVDVDVMDVDVAHSPRAMDPDEPTNMSSFSAFECTQAFPQRIRLNEVAP